MLMQKWNTEKENTYLNFTYLNFCMMAFSHKNLRLNQLPRNSSDLEAIEMFHYLLLLREMRGNENRYLINIVTDIIRIIYMNQFHESN